MKLSPAGARLIESFEGFRSAPYHGALDPRGLWTIGYGTTEGVGPNTRPVTPARAQALLMSDVDRRFAPAINALRLPLNQNQFDALVSFVYNVGPGAIGPSTHVGRALRAHQWRAAADAMLLWDHAGGQVSAGLARRRRRERALFLAPVDGAPHAHHNGHHRIPTHHDEPPRERQHLLTPADLEAASHNGSVPDHLLAPVPGGRLRLDAAAAFNAMNAESEQRFGVTLRSEGPLGTYRTLHDQRILRQQYLDHKGNLAAKPGHSNHGLGLAIDLGSQRMRQIVDEIGARYGWAKRWSDAPSEWWHLVYRPGVWHPTQPPARTHPRPDTRSEATAIVQQLLRRHGHPTLPVNGEATPGTRSALLAFQRAHGLEPTGGIDRATVAALRGHPVRPAPRPVHDHGQDPMPEHPHHHPTHRRTHHTGPPRHRRPPAHRKRPPEDHTDPPHPILKQPKVPLNRIVALLGPFIAIFAGVAASWLSQNFPGLVTDESAARADIIQGSTFIVGMISTWGLQHKYLDGWQKWEGGVMQIELAKSAQSYDDSSYQDDDYDDSDQYDDSGDGYDDSYDSYDPEADRSDADYYGWNAGRS